MAGRKSKYHTHVQPKLKLIQNWCKDGDIEATIVKRLGVAMSTFCEYKLKYAELVEALKNGKEEIDYMVENALLKRALGYKTLEKHKEIDKDGNEKIKEILKEVAPEVIAQIFWLKNRRPDKWRDKHDINQNNANFENDGFIEAINGTAKEDWEDDNNS